MKICFIPWMLESVSELKKADEVIPIGILTLSEIIKNNGYEVEFYDVNKRINQLPYGFSDDRLYETIAEELVKINADIYGISTILEGYHYQMLVAEKIKQIYPNKIVCLGGPQASTYAKETLEEFRFVDYIIRGEAENSIINFLKLIEGKQSISEVQGLCYRTCANEIIINPDAPLVENLDGLPFISYDFMDVERMEYIPIEAGRGCPFTCSFCSSSSYFKRKYRLKSVTRLIHEIEWLIKKYGIYNFGFIHDLFTLDKKYILSFCDELLAKGINIKWSCSARADKLDSEMIDKMQKAGCIGLFFGIESGSYVMQKVMNKNVDLNIAMMNIEYAQQKGINIMASFVFGFPQEKYEYIIETLKLRNELIKKGIQSANPKLLRPVKGSPIYSEYPITPFIRSICLHRLYKVRCSEIIEDMVSRYPDIFSYYYAYTPEHISINTLVALGLIISSEDFITSQTLLVEIHGFDFIEMLKSFDSLSIHDDIRAYEDHYLGFLRNKAENDPKVDVIYQVALYEKDKLEFLRAIEGQEDNTRLNIRLKKYNYQIEKINNIFSLDIMDEIQEGEYCYVFYCSYKDKRIHVLSINKKLYEFMAEYLENKSLSEVKEILLLEDIRNIKVLDAIRKEFIL